MNKYKFSIGIPTINQFDYLQESINALNKYLPDVDIIIYNNSNINLLTKIKINNNIKIIGTGYNVGVAAAWNTMLADMKANGYEYALILNDDIVLSENIKLIHEYLELKPSFARILNDWSVFLISIETYSKVGLFDEKFFPAYFEDCDYQYRMFLNNISVDFPRFLIPEIYRTSCSIKENPNLNKNYRINRQYYIQKWGGEPNQELFTKPFNNIN
jgi:GT2 family glycosyltransferase